MEENRTDRDQVKREFMQQLLDSYFLVRRPLPESGFFQENKTTQQIMQELAPMMAIPTENIVEYMLAHDYSTTTGEDGSVCWAVWRRLTKMD